MSIVKRCQRHLVSLGLLCFAAGCGGATAPTPQNPEPVEEVAKTPLSPAQELANKVEPDSISPLLWNVPPWVISEIRRADFKADELVGAYNGLMEEAQKTGNPQKTQVVHGIFVALLGLEEHRANDRCDANCLGTLTSMYSRLASWDRNDADVLVGALLHNLEWTSVGPERARELRQFFVQLLDNSVDHANTSLAALLRIDSRSGAAASALVATALMNSEQGNYDLARDLYAASVDWTDGAPSRWHLTAASNACYRALDLNCGNRFGDASLGVTDPAELAEAKETRTAFREVAEEAVRLRDQIGLEERVRLGAALVRLGRVNHAKKVYQALTAGYPEDARGFVGLAKLTAQEDVLEAAAVVARAGEQNRDSDYYELALGTWFAGPVRDILQGQDPLGKWPELAQDLPRVRALIEEYRLLDPARGDVLSIVVNAGEKILPIMVQDRKEWAQYKATFFPAVENAVLEAKTAAARFPDNSELARLRLVLAAFDANPARAIKTVREVGKSADTELTAMRRNVQFVLGLRKGSKSMLGELRKELASLKSPTPAEKSMKVDLWAVSLSQTRRSNWGKVVGEYEALAQSATDEVRSRLLNNLGVARLAAGDKAAAAESLRLAMTMEQESMVPGVNLYALADDDTAADAALQWVNEREPKGSRREKEMAGAWQIAKRVKDRRQRAAELAKARQSEPDLLSDLKADTKGAFAENSFDMGFGYEFDKGLIIQINLDTKLWLWLEP